MNFENDDQALNKTDKETFMACLKEAVTSLKNATIGLNKFENFIDTGDDDEKNNEHCSLSSFNENKLTNQANDVSDSENIDGLQNPSSDENNDDQVAKMLFDIENEIRQSQLIRKEKIFTQSTVPADYEQANLPRRQNLDRSDEFVDPLEKMQKAKIDNLTKQTDHYKNMYIESSSELKSLKQNIREKSLEIEATKDRTKTLTEDVANKNKMIMLLECRLSEQQNNFDNQKVKLEHQFEQNKKRTKDKYGSNMDESDDFGSNEDLRLEYGRMYAESGKLKEKAFALRESVKRKNVVSEQGKISEEECRNLQEQVSSLKREDFFGKSHKNLVSRQLGESNQNMILLENDIFELKDAFSNLEARNEQLDLEIQEKINMLEKLNKDKNDMEVKYNQVKAENEILKSKEGRSDQDIKKRDKELSRQIEEHKKAIMHFKKKYKDAKETGERTQTHMNAQLKESEQVCQEFKSEIEECVTELRERVYENSQLHNKITQMEGTVKEVGEIKINLIRQQQQNFETEIRNKKLMNELISENKRLFKSPRPQGTPSKSPDQKIELLQRRLDECESSINQMHNTSAFSLEEALSQTTRIQLQLNDISQVTNSDRVNMGSMQFGRMDDYMDRVRAIEERSIRLRQILTDIRHDII